MEGHEEVSMWELIQDARGGDEFSLGPQEQRAIT